MKFFSFLSIPVAVITMKEMIGLVDESIQENKRLWYIDINASKAVAMQTDESLFNCLKNCDIVGADGKSIVWASRFLGKTLPERIAGIDIMENLVSLAYQKGYKCFFFGATEEIVQKLVSVYSLKYAPTLIAGYRNGYYKQEEEKDIVKQIVDSKANILFVATSSPKQEMFLCNHKNALNNINFMMGVGGSFDVIAGLRKRAPLWMQKAGLEWVMRLIQEPRRMWRRYLIGNWQFLLLIIREKMKK
jgi:N-acetylglucosaminyldiphosphoundecaprenol N-acetyl-beta-D-mannosaminyltransferase